MGFTESEDESKLQCFPETVPLGILLVNGRQVASVFPAPLLRLQHRLLCPFFTSVSTPSSRCGSAGVTRLDQGAVAGLGAVSDLTTAGADTLS